MKDAETLRFRRQFFLSRCSTRKFASWNHAVVADRWSLEVHPDLSLTQVESNGAQLTLLGFMIDPEHPERNDATILQDLASRSSARFLENLTRISGRWVLIAKLQSRTLLVNDPAGLRSVFYTLPGTEPFACASQPGLIASILDLSYSNEGEAFIGSAYCRQNPEYWWPAGSSLYNGISHLMPNHYLDLENRETRRFWPCTPIDRMPLKPAAEKSADLLKRLIEGAGRRFEIALPLTAGLDSRTILAATVDIRDSVYFYTLKYWKLNDSSPDIRVPGRLAQQLKFEHRVIDCSGRMDAAFRNMYMNNVADAHESWGDIAYGLNRSYPQQKVCLKGNVSEIARSSVYFNIKYPDAIDGQVLAELVRMDGVEYAGRRFDEWLRNTRDIAEACRIDILDLFYWEHKMGIWQAMSQLEWDLVQETFTPFNCRELICTLLSADIKYRKETRYILYERIIRNLWPEVLREPVNPQPFKVVRHGFKMALKHAGFDRMLKKLA